MGDFLLSKCFMMLSEIQVHKTLAVRLAKLVNKICLGEIKQHQLRYKCDMTPMEYIRIVSGKTAALFSVGLSAGAHATKAPEETVKLLGHIGYEIGMTFQLVDDLLDYVGSEDTVGKSVQSDLVNGYYNMPVIMALKSDQAEAKVLKSLLEKGLDDENIKNAIGLIDACGGIEATKKLAIKYHYRALALINKLPDHPSKVLLQDMMPKLINRVT